MGLISLLKPDEWNGEGVSCAFYAPSDEEALRLALPSIDVGIPCENVLHQESPFSPTPQTIQSLMKLSSMAGNKNISLIGFPHSDISSAAFLIITVARNISVDEAWESLKKKSPNACPNQLLCLLGDQHLGTEGQLFAKARMGASQDLGAMLFK